MAQIRAIEARGLLDDIAQGAKSSGVTLIQAIRDTKSAVLSSSFKQGRVYISTSGNGQSASFLIPSTLTSDYTPTRVAAQLMEFVEIWNNAVTNGQITNTQDTSDATTDSNLAVMLADDRLASVTARRLDITGIRFPGTVMQG